MPNSAISFNTSGLATSTSPGLVGTGAQTFAGKKTLDGGALIKSDTSGLAIPSGYTFEVDGTWQAEKSVSAGTGAPASGTYYSLGGRTIQPGTYQISLTVQANGTGNTVVVGCVSTTSAANANLDAIGVGSSVDFYYAATYATSATLIRATQTFILRVTSANTYYLRMRCDGSPANIISWATIMRIG